MSAVLAPADRAHDDVTTFLESREATCNPKTIATYGFYVRPFVAWLDGRPISAALIGAYLLERKKAKIAPATIDDTYRILKTFCRWLVDDNRLDHDPFSGPGRVRRPQRTRKRRRVYTDADVVKLLAATMVRSANKRRHDLKRQRWAASGPYARESMQAKTLVLLLCDSALRAEEVCKLTCGQVRAAELIVESKGGHEDVAFVGLITRKALVELAGDRPDTDPLFRDWRGKACTTRALRSILVRLAKRAGVKLPPRPLHAFRHYAARQWVKAKVPDLAIRQLMRHQDLETTKIYTELEASELAELHADASRMQKLLDQAAAEAAPHTPPEVVSARRTRRLRTIARWHKRTNSKS